MTTVDPLLTRRGALFASAAGLALAARPSAALAVADEGLGACFVGAFRDAEVSELLALPAHVRPLGIVPIGHPAESPPGRKLRALTEAVHNERWQRPEKPSRTP